MLKLLLESPHNGFIQRLAKSRKLILLLQLKDHELWILAKDIVHCFSNTEFSQITSRNIIIICV